MHQVAITRAVIFLDGRGWDPRRNRVAGVPPLLRSLRILLRFDIDSITLVSPTAPPAALTWSEGLGFQTTTVQKWQATGEPVLALDAETVFDKATIRHIGTGSREFAQLVLPPAGDDPAFVVGPVTGSFSRFSELCSACATAGSSREMRLPQSVVCAPVRSRLDARQMHRRLEAGLVKETDGLFARWNRKISIPLSRLLAPLPITPNMVSYATLALGALGGYFLAQGGYWHMLLGALLTQSASILDGNDGELARLKILDSDFGTWLDTLCDYVSYFITFGGVSYGLYNRTGLESYLYLGALMFVGTVISMAAASHLRRSRVPKGHADEISAFITDRLEVVEGDFGAFVSKHIKHFATRAVFSYFLVLFALFDLWVAILILATIGSHAFWIGIVYNSRYIQASE